MWIQKIFRVKNGKEIFFNPKKVFGLTKFGKKKLVKRIILSQKYFYC